MDSGFIVCGRIVLLVAVVCLLGDRLKPLCVRLPSVLTPESVIHRVSVKRICRSA